VALTQKNASKPSLRPRVAILGAGSCGLVALKTLREYGLDVVCFEQGREVGGLWVLNNSSGRGGTYESLHINTSKTQTQFSDFPFPDELGNFPHHSHIANYLRNYAQHFELLRDIRFNEKVDHCAPLDGGGYQLTTAHSTERFDALIVANGHHFAPLLPEHSLYSEFKGSTLHSYDYRSPDRPLALRGRRVVVVGMGNSAMDIACELSRSDAAQHVTVSARRGAWVMPKYLRGKPIDGPAFFPHWLPGKLRRRLVTRAFELIYGKMSDFGLPEPDHLIGESHPTISTEFPHLVKNGDIELRPGFRYADGDRVHFTDGSSSKCDTIIFCTGYKIEFPFFSNEHICAPENQIDLFYRVFHPEHRHVFFIGLLQTIGAVMPVAEAQARAIGMHLCGAYNLPDKASMLASINIHSQMMSSRFVQSARHTMQVIPEAFHPALNAELEAGVRRAQRKVGIAFPSTNAAQ
jgi:dimethylaniline monooxygenase (N-oxide forming)